MRRVPLLCALSFSVMSSALAGPALAAEPSGERFPDAQPPLGLLPTPPDALMDPTMARSWGTLPARSFAIIFSNMSE